MADIDALARAGIEAFNARDETAARSFWADDVVMRAPGMPETRGIDAAVAFEKIWWDACSDAHIEVLHQAVLGDTVIQHALFRGTQDGVLRTPMGEIDPTRKTIEGKLLWVFRFEGDKIVDAEILFDRMQVMEQLGATPQPATA